MEHGSSPQRRRDYQAENKQRIIHALAQNNPSMTGVQMKVDQRDEAISFFKILATNSVCDSVKVTGPGVDDKSGMKRCGSHCQTAYICTNLLLIYCEFSIPYMY